MPSEDGKNRTYDGAGEPLNDAQQRSRVGDAVVAAAGFHAAKGSGGGSSRATGDSPLYGKARLVDPRRG